MTNTRWKKRRDNSDIEDIRGSIETVRVSKSSAKRPHTQVDMFRTSEDDRVVGKKYVTDSFRKSIESYKQKAWYEEYVYPVNTSHTLKKGE